MSEDGGSPRPDTMDVDSPPAHITPTSGIKNLNKNSITPIRD